MITYYIKQIFQQQLLLGACKCNLLAFYEIMTNQPTNRPTNQPSNQRRDMRGHSEVTHPMIRSFIEYLTSCDHGINYTY